MKHSTHRAPRGLAACLAIALLAAACSSTAETASTFADLPADAAESTTTTTTDQEPDTTTTADDMGVEDQDEDSSEETLEFAPCGEESECATLEVPLDYDDPAGETTEIHVTRHKARSESIGTMFLNPGGPGFGVENMVHGMGQWAPHGEMFDLVGVDPRGTGKSNPIDCNSNWEDDFDFELTPDDGFADDTDLTNADFSEMAAECASEHSLEFLASITTENAARDIETVRVALGGEPFNYLGYSYGTAIGSVYATLFPDSIRSMVLDGAVPTDPAETGIDIRLADVEAAFARLDKSCELWSGCAVADIGLLNAIEAVEVELDESGPIGPLTKVNYGSAINAMIGLPVVFRDVTQGLADALDGDGELLSWIGNDFLSPIPTGGYVEFSGANPAIICADGWNLWTGTTAELLPQAERTAVNEFVGAGWEIPCDLWPVVGDGIPEVRYTGDTEILVIGNTYDPITPFVYSQQLTQDLGANATLLQFDGSAHTATFSDSACIDDHVLAYFIEGDLPDEGTVCLDRGLVGFGHNDEGEILIDGITPGSPAEAAGLQVGDRILSVDGIPIVTGADISSGGPGTVMEFVIERNGTEMELSATRGLSVWELWRDAE